MDHEKPVHWNVPAGIVDGTFMRIEGHGLPYANDITRKGDIVVRFRVPDLDALSIGMFLIKKLLDCFRITR